MNRIFKAVWNESTGTWVAASETSKSKTKRSSARKLAIVQALIIGVGSLAVASGAHAADDCS
ncbi:ESPR domain-containing protein [Caballeronia sp. 15711]|uniref:ESPR domain-containing protein n=1 Tax=Caballeronia sp. 15711 TaxID=3391029 RepID=UPI0039E63162